MAELPGFVRYGAYPSDKDICPRFGLSRSGHGVIGFPGQTLVNQEKGYYVRCGASTRFVSDSLTEFGSYTILADIIRASPENRALLGEELMQVDNTDYPPTQSLTEYAYFALRRATSFRATVSLSETVNLK